MQMQLRYEHDPPQPSNTFIGLLDVFRGLSEVNAKNVEYSTRDGHVMGALVDLTFTSEQQFEANVYTVPNTWKFMNAFRKFHIYRREMFRKAGVSENEMGRYSHTIRPRMFAKAISVDNMTTQLGKAFPADIAEAQIVPTDAIGGDWDLTKLASSIPFFTGTGTEDAGDIWNLHILGDHTIDATFNDKEIWESVGMILAYNQDRQEVQVQTADTSIEPSNPLAALKSQTPSAAEITEIVEEQEEQLPPYDLGDLGDSTNAAHAATVRVVPYTGGDINTAQVTLKNVFLPA